MARNTTLLGAFLTILGTCTFALLGFDVAKWTALLPALFGVLFLLLGIYAQKKEAWHRHLMHAAVVLALLALLGTSSGLVQTVALLKGSEVTRPAAAVEQSITALLCTVFLAGALRSFLTARRARVSEGV
ncbi:MAG: hypothetical protein ACE5G0_21495 [Rhodothermales bacterium]